MPNGQFPVLVAGQVYTAATIQAFSPWYAWKAADTPRSNNAVLAADPDLAVPVAANARYKVEAFLIITGDAPGSGGFAFSFSAPAGANLQWTEFAYATAVSAAGLAIAAVVGAGTSRSVVTDGAVALPVFVRGDLVTGGTSGQLALTWAQNASDATATVLKASSDLTLTRMA